MVFTGFLFLSSLVVPGMYSALQRPDSENKASVHVAPGDPQDAEKKAAPVESADDVEEEAGETIEETIGETVTVAMEA